MVRQSAIKVIEMELQQSALQGFLNRLYTHFFLYLLPQIIGLVIISLIKQAFVGWQLIVILAGINLLWALWLLVFNSGRGKVQAFSVNVSADSITVTVFGRHKQITRAQFGGCRLKGYFPREIQLINHAGKDIYFSYYALSSAQREALFNELGCEI